MTRNTLSDIASGIQGWDATINDNNAVLVENPLPIVEYATIGEVPAFGAHDRSLAMVNHAELGFRPFFSSGSKWLLNHGYTLAGPFDGSASTDRTSINLVHGFHNTVSVLGYPAMEDGKIQFFSFGVKHTEGSLPADWTLTVRNDTTSVEVTGVIVFNAADDTWNGGSGALSAPLVINAGDEITFKVSGASIAITKVTIHVFIDYEFDLVAPS